MANPRNVRILCRTSEEAEKVMNKLLKYTLVKTWIDGQPINPQKDAKEFLWPRILVFYLKQFQNGHLAYAREQDNDMAMTAQDFLSNASRPTFTIRFKVRVIRSDRDKFFMTGQVFKVKPYDPEDVMTPIQLGVFKGENEEFQVPYSTTSDNLQIIEIHKDNEIIWKE